MNMAKREKKFPLLMTALSLLLILVTLITLALATGAADKLTAFNARSIGDASYDCEDKIHKRFEEDLISKYFDNFSSRYEPEKRQYVVYYRVSVNVDKGSYTEVTDMMAKCIVWERLGYVSDFQIIKI